MTTSTEVTPMKEIPSEIVIENEKEVVSIGVIKSFEETPNFPIIYNSYA
jgi:hypothetical protein